MSDEPRLLSRRGLLLGGTAALGAGLTAKLLWKRRGPPRAATVIARCSSYAPAQLETLIRQGLVELGLGRAALKGKVILLKPNLVEPCAEAPHINTNPVFVRAVAEVLRRWDAREVLVGEGPGHYRDTELVLEESGLGPALEQDRIPFVDLNHDETYTVTTPSHVPALKTLTLPRTLRRCDWIVSLPKMKTHHWAGVTLAMKNLFGLLPGVIYGWPKNPLHHAGIASSIVAINATVRPQLALVDGIIGMEGDGPIMGEPKHTGLIVMGRNLPAVDATAARLMGFDPQRLEYLALAGEELGPIAAREIEQRGESIEGAVQRFRLLDHPALSALRAAQR